MADRQKVYIGNARMEQRGNFDFMRIRGKTEKLVAAVDWLRANGQEWFSIDIMERRQPSDKGMTHYGVLDTYIANAEREHDERRGAARDDAQGGRPAMTRAYRPNPLRPYPTHDQPPPRRPVGPPAPPLTPDDGDVSDLEDDIPF